MEPELVRYLASIVPGEIRQLEDRYQINHSNGDVSTLWLKPDGTEAPSSLQSLQLIFDEFDGADLLSSTFKIASLNASRALNGVQITPTLAELADLAVNERLLARRDCVPFMTEAGIWIYLFDPTSHVIRKWNLEDHEECDSYPSIRSIVEEWVRVVLES
jgi:hypothetical protein